MFMCGKREQAVSRLHRLVISADEKAKGHYIQVYMECGGMVNMVADILGRSLEICT